MQYTGKAVDLRSNDRGIEFDVVITDELGNEVFRNKQWISTGVMTGLDAKEGVKRQVERMTQEIWAHKEGSKEALSYKNEIESYRASCSSFIAPVNRPLPQKVGNVPTVTE